MPFIYIVARERRDLYERLKADFADQDEIAVILDRRRGERRLARAPQRVDLRRRDRRTRRELNGELRTVGAFITYCEGRTLIEIF